MNARIVRMAGLLTLLMAVPLAGCGDSGVGDEERRASAVEAARRYTQASLDRRWKEVCESVTERLRKGTVAECIEMRDLPRVGDYMDARVAMGKPFDMEADGPYRAGVGVRATMHLDPATGNRIDTALRLILDGDDGWLIDQAANMDASLGTGPEVARARLEEVAETTGPAAAQ
ncbi:hypothetical protein ACFWFI_35760 [Streptomyces sp. NPDC060209]|uniref:hypothetical protein n=1 Tax=Streptomyces sp. NPDC060209 TaxID=3347073 RepID=UPI00364B0EAC